MNRTHKEVPFGELLGKTIVAVYFTKIHDSCHDHIVFTLSDMTEYRMYYEPDCCARAHLEDICGDLNDLVGHPILLAETATNKTDPPSVAPSDPPIEEEDSCTWTFYKLSTIKGSVTIRWCGTSNGYYSEEVSFVKVVAEEEE